MDEHEDHEDHGEHNSSPEPSHWDEPPAAPVTVTEPVEDDGDHEDDAYEDDMS
jgi:hypothetical protein